MRKIYKTLSDISTVHHVLVYSLRYPKYRDLHPTTSRVLALSTATDERLRYDVPTRAIRSRLSAPLLHRLVWG